MIVYQGFEGAYSHLACQHVFPDKTACPANTFQQAMFAVENGQANLAMIPVENSTAGRVEEIYRLIPKMRLHIVGEHFETVNHCLLGLRGSSIDNIKTVASHPQALAQCAQHIEEKGLTAIAVLDTAGAAADLQITKNASHSAIASELAAERYDLDILQRNFQDKAGNTTRFIILSREPSPPPYHPNKNYITSIIFKVRNIPAALYKSLGGFATNGVNLLKLESYMPNGTMNASQFHADIEGHIEDGAMKRALEELSYFAEESRLLGTYAASPFRKTSAFHDQG